MSVCEHPVVWDADGSVEERCEADRPCPYHDTDSLTPEQRKAWRQHWATRWLRESVIRKHGRHG